MNHCQTGKESALEYSDEGKAQKEDKMRLEKVFEELEWSLKIITVKIKKCNAPRAW